MPPHRIAACGALGNITVNADNKVKVAAAGGIETILAGMTANKASAGVQKQACGALRNLSANNPANKDAVAAAGGIEALATSMKTHQASALLQEYACGALYNLAINASLRGRIKAAGGVELVKRAVSASDVTQTPRTPSKSS
jgi:vacuolar protein 8